MANECRFELKELLCMDCKRPTGNLGTCADSDYCPDCKKPQGDQTSGEVSRFLIHIAENASEY